MRITVNIPDEIMKDLIKYTKAKSNSQAVKFALKEWHRTKKIQQLKSLRGKLNIDLDVEKLHASDEF